MQFQKLIKNFNRGNVRKVFIRPTFTSCISLIERQVLEKASKFTVIDDDIIDISDMRPY